MTDTPDLDGARAALLHLAGELIGELDGICQRLARIDRLAGALLAQGDPAILDEPTRRALLALRRVAAARARAYDATRDDAGAIRGDPAGPDPSA